jgi:glycosyltransferase involved in cell wall biosynthesis
MKTISIVTTVFNGAHTIATTLDSVAALIGSVPGVEVVQHIITDGGSKDNTHQVVMDWLAAHPDYPLEWYSEPDLGIYDGMNKGIMRARGDWIGIINADDAYAPNALRHYAPYLHEEVILHGQLLVDGRVVGPQQYKPTKHFRPMRKMAAQHPTCFVPRSVYQKVGLFQNAFRLSGDYEFLLRAHLRGVKFHYVPAVIAHFAKGGASGQHTIRAWREMLAAQLLNRRSTVAAVADYAWKRVKFALRKRA